MPSHRTILGVDVLKSALLPSRQLNEVPKIVDELLAAAFTASGIQSSDVVARLHTGDGAVLTLPDELLGAAVDATQCVDELARQRNQSYKPEIRLRMALHMGFLPEGDGFYRPKIDLIRLLDAPAFREVLDRAAAGFPEGRFNSGLILSDSTYRAVFADRYTELVDMDEFTRVEVVTKEHASTAWVRVPGAGYGMTPFGRITADPPSRSATPAAVPTVVNHASGDVNGVQANQIHGGVRIARP